MNNTISLLYGALLGTAVGDAYGLPFEGMTPKRIAKMSPEKAHYRLIPILHGGMVSDDTEHAIMTVQAHIASGGNVLIFKQSLAWRLRFWLFRLPAGIGLATLRAIVKMCFGLRETGVFSAGNGGAMRTAVLGVLIDDIDELKEWVKASTRLTHTDPKAEQGALLIALLAWAETRHADWDTAQILHFAFRHIDDNELIEKVKNFQPNAKTGISGYVYHTVPAVCAAWQQHRNTPLQGMQQLIAWGGDTDTTCAIFGGVVGVRHGESLWQAVSGAWCEPVLRHDYFADLATQAIEVQANRQAQKPLAWGGAMTCLRNVGFMAIVLAHGFRRLLPPY